MSASGPDWPPNQSGFSEFQIPIVCSVVGDNEGSVEQSKERHGMCSALERLTGTEKNVRATRCSVDTK